jgi:hypothetical protein
MKKFLILLCLASIAVALGAQAPAGKILYVYDEANEQSAPYIGYFKSALAAEGIEYDETTAARVPAMDLTKYRALLVHGMVMAFTSKSPVRDWLKAEKRLAGRRVALLVTANRWFLDKHFKQLGGLLEKDGAAPVDAVSAATKNLDAAAKEAAVRNIVARLATVPPR